MGQRLVEIEGVAVDDVHAGIKPHQMFVEVGRIFDRDEVFRFDATLQDGLGDGTGRLCRKVRPSGRRRGADPRLHRHSQRRRHGRFRPGIVDKGKEPFHPYQIKDNKLATLANERIEVHAGQREFLGPFEVDAQGKALFFTTGVDGAEAVDLFVIPKDTGDQWLSLYIHQQGTTPPVYPPLMSDVAAAVTPYRKYSWAPEIKAMRTSFQSSSV